MAEETAAHLMSSVSHPISKTYLVCHPFRFFILKKNWSPKTASGKVIPGSQLPVLCRQWHMGRNYMVLPTTTQAVALTSITISQYLKTKKCNSDKVIQTRLILWTILKFLNPVIMHEISFHLFLLHAVVILFIGKIMLNQDIFYMECYNIQHELFSAWDELS